MAGNPLPGHSPGDVRPVVPTVLPPWQDESGDCTKITGVRCILTAPEGVTLVVVRVDTNVAGLHGLGCATFTQRAHTVTSAVSEYLEPALIGRDPADITDIWQVLHADPYWRSGPVLNNALSGVDMALWDIKGKQLGVPVWQLLGGRCRTEVPAYTRAGGRDASELVDEVQRVVDSGFGYVRCDVVPSSASAAQAWDPIDYVRTIPEVLLRVRDAVGDGVELIHDVHQRVPPHLAARLARKLDACRLFFLEDIVPTEDVEWLAAVRAATSAPLAIGELFTNPREYVPLIRDRLLDFVRCHVSAIGGITPAWRVANLCEYFGVQTAWHGPKDVSPVGQAANLALDAASPSFGIQEFHPFSDVVREIFPGTATARGGAVAVSDAPGLGIEIDERLAARHPAAPVRPNWQWARLRRVDGAVQPR
jgi:mannonate dehydratase